MGNKLFPILFINNEHNMNKNEIKIGTLILEYMEGKFDGFDLVFKVDEPNNTIHSLYFDKGTSGFEIDKNSISYFVESKDRYLKYKIINKE